MIKFIKNIKNNTSNFEILRKCKGYKICGKRDGIV